MSHMSGLLTLIMLLLGVALSFAQEEMVPVANRIYSPFIERNRQSIDSITNRVFSRFGVSRKTPIKGHLHSGIDLHGVYGEKVYAIGSGRVERYYWVFPNIAVAIKHTLPDGTSIYSAYIHLADVKVREGDPVDEHTELGRIFNKKEMKRSGFRTPHLHLEIRRDFLDQGNASFSSMTRIDLEKHLLDPLIFLSKTMR